MSTLKSNPHMSAENPLNIDPDNLPGLVSSGAVHVIDVREPHEYAAGHVPGAHNHPLGTLNPSKLPTDKPIVLICMGGGRSLKGVHACHGAGRTDAIHYQPGTRGWVERGNRVEK